MTSRTLPPLGQGAHNVVAGTYVAEQRSSASYDLVSALRGNGGKKPPDASSSRRRRAYQRMDECTELPALVIEPLLSNYGRGATEEAAETMASTLPRLVQKGRRGVATDDAFKDWLTLPREVSGGKRWGAPTPTSDNGEETSWHVLLLRKTFESPDLHPGLVAEILVDAMRIDHTAAEQKVQEAQKHTVTLLSTFPDKTAAFKAVQLLRAEGLLVQVTSSAGLPGEGSTHKSARQCYADIFDHYRAVEHSWGAGSGRAPGQGHQQIVLPPVGNRRRTCATWRRAADMDVNVMPEDPVAALFQAEERQGQDAPTSCCSRSTVRNSPKRSPKCLIASAPTSARRSLNLTIATEDAQQEAQEHLEKTPSLLGLMKKHKMVNNTTPRLADGLSQVVAAAKGGAQDVDEAKASEVQAPTAKRGLTAACKEACTILRVLVFGYVGNENAKTQREKEMIFSESICTMVQVEELLKFWGSLDDDNSGRVDKSEYRVYAEIVVRERMKNTTPTQANVPEHLADFNGGTPVAIDDPKAISKLCDKLATTVFGKKSSFAVEDLLRHMWPCVTAPEMKQMKAWMRDTAAVSLRNRVKTPPLLDPSELDGLKSVFRHFDDDNSGEVSLEEIVEKGLIYEDQAEAYFAEWDQNGDGCLNLEEFCQMMCPAGFRATANSKIALQADGAKLIRAPQGWRLEGH